MVLLKIGHLAYMYIELANKGHRYIHESSFRYAKYEALASRPLVYFSSLFNWMTHFRFLTALINVVYIMCILNMLNVFLFSHALSALVSGLRNSANNCWLNSTLQSFSNVFDCAYTHTCIVYFTK